MIDGTFTTSRAPQAEALSLGALHSALRLGLPDACERRFSRPQEPLPGRVGAGGGDSSPDGLSPYSFLVRFLRPVRPAGQRPGVERRADRQRRRDAGRDRIGHVVNRVLRRGVRRPTPARASPLDERARARSRACDCQRPEGPMGPHSTARSQSAALPACPDSGSRYREQRSDGSRTCDRRANGRRRCPRCPRRTR